MRHRAYVTWLVTAGRPLSEVAALVGHSDSWVTQRYSHLVPGAGEEALAVLSKITSVPSVSPPRSLKIIPGA